VFYKAQVIIIIIIIIIIYRLCAGYLQLYIRRTYIPEANHVSSSKTNGFYHVSKVYNAVTIL